MSGEAVPGYTARVSCHRPFSCQRQSFRRSHRSFLRAKNAFSLIESAIILAVIGLVIGGVWLAAAAMQQEFRKSELQRGIALTVSGIRDLLPLQNWPTTTLPVGGATSIRSLLLSAGKIPAPMIKNNSVINPINGQTMDITLLHPPTYTYYAIRIVSNTLTKADADLTVTAFIEGQKSTVSYSYCTNSGTNWVYNPPTILPWPPNCPANSTQALVYYFFNGEQ